MEAVSLSTVADVTCLMFLQVQKKKSENLTMGGKKK